MSALKGKEGSKEGREGERKEGGKGDKIKDGESR